MQTHTKGPSVTYDNFLTIISVFIIMLTIARIRTNVYLPDKHNNLLTQPQTFS